MKQLSYKGYTYQPTEENDGDCTKIWHDIYKGKKRVTSADFTPYAYMDKEDFMNFVDCGLPNRVSNSPLNKDDLDRLLNSYIERGRG